MSANRADQATQDLILGAGESEAALHGNPQILAVIQARMGSTRLPGKVLVDIGGETTLSRVVKRVRRSKLIGDVIVATTSRPIDEAIVDECARLSVSTFRGEEEDVLDRYYKTAQAWRADVVVRITSDCPLIDSGIVDHAIQSYLNSACDYASNTFDRSYPRGLDAEVMSAEALERCWRGATKSYERSHVTPYIYQHPDLFKIYAVRGETDYSFHRWTLDTPDDLKLIRAIYAHFSNRDDFLWTDVLALMKRRPELVDLNRHVVQKSLQEG